ncbi:MAG TPA: inositol monophosphatase [Propionibacteriaceae bacterium]|nr:inositol monophosphatase [Propionibacteriaceae bacterium]
METETVLAIMRDVADRIITPRFRALADGEIDQKRPGDYVTIADRESEAELGRLLLETYPDAAIVGEEAVFDDPDALSLLRTHPHVFVVDPVDGTRNFVHGSPEHAVIVAEVVGGEAVRGWILQPALGHAYVTEKGEGVWRDAVRMTPPLVPKPPLGWSSISKTHGLTSPLLAAPLARTHFCCGIDYPLMFAGETGFIAYGPPKPWDHVAATLMLREFGGVARTTDGQEYGPTSTGPALIVALDEETWQAADQALGDRIRR